MAINLDLTNPTNVIRAMVGDVDMCDPIMSEMMYQQIYDIQNVDGKEENTVIWLSAIQACFYIKAHYAPEAMRYRERVNAVEFEQYGGERYKNYCDLMDWLRGNPPAISTGAPLFHFGGTYTSYDKISMLQYMNICLETYWGYVWRDGYYVEAV